MLGRDPTEEHRNPAPLELFADLTAVVAIALCAEEPHNGPISGHVVNPLIAFSVVHFASWCT
jgi:hypothetical protein